MKLDPDAALAYVDFVCERHRIWELRQAGEPGPWTEDPILAGQKFTNVFRVLDPGSQYVFTLAPPEADPLDVLVRLFLYRHTGRVEPWEWLELSSGLPTTRNLYEVFQAWKQYRGEGVVQLKSERKPGQTGRGNGYQKTVFTRPIFTGAYLVFPQSAERGTDKLESIVNLTERLIFAGVFDDFLEAETQAERFATLRRNKGVADFMSMQILTDWGYTPQCGEDREEEYVVLGPGARRGAQALLGHNTGKLDDVLSWCREALEADSRCPELATDGVGDGYRRPSLMDLQNTLCEFSKYHRTMTSGSLPKKPYAPAHPGKQPDPVLPQHW